MVPLVVQTCIDSTNRKKKHDIVCTSRSVIPWPLNTGCSRGARLIVVPREVSMVAKLPVKNQNLLR